MAANNYAYAVTRIRVKENTLLTAGDMQRMLAAMDEGAVRQILRDKGWEAAPSMEMQSILQKEKAKTWSLMRELLKEDIHRLDVFLYADDYLNLKSAVKETRLEKEYDGIFSAGGSIPAEQIRQAVSKKRFELLPEEMAKAAREALDVYLRTGDGQLSDILLDRAALDSIYLAGQKAHSEFLKLYAEITVAGADLKIALRAQRTGKTKDFYEKAIAECDTLDKKALIAAAMSGIDALSAYLENTCYAAGAEKFRSSMAAFEKWCDDLLMEKIRPQKYQPFGIEPLAAYVLARESEMKSVRIILSGKLNQLPAEIIKERIRETYA